MTPQPMTPTPIFLMSSPFRFVCCPWRPSALHGSGGEAGDDVFLREKEKHYRRQDCQCDEREDQVPFGRILTLIDHDTERPRIHAVAVQHHQGNEVGIPT